MGVFLQRTCLICWRVSVVDRAVVCSVVVGAAAAVSWSLVVVAHDASLADVSKTELTSGLALLSDASYNTNVNNPIFLPIHDSLVL